MKTPGYFFQISYFGVRNLFGNLYPESCNSPSGIFRQGLPEHFGSYVASYWCAQRTQGTEAKARDGASCVWTSRRSVPELGASAGLGSVRGTLHFFDYRTRERNEARQEGAVGAGRASTGETPPRGSVAQERNRYERTPVPLVHPHHPHS